MFPILLQISRRVLFHPLCKTTVDFYKDIDETVPKNVSSTSSG